MKKDFQTYPNSVEGRRQGEWILMDYVDFGSTSSWRKSGSTTISNG